MLERAGNGTWVPYNLLLFLFDFLMDRMCIMVALLLCAVGYTLRADALSAESTRCCGASVSRKGFVFGARQGPFWSV